MPQRHFSDEWLLLARDPARADRTYTEFYDRHERPVIAYHLRRTKDPEVAADLAAETFAQALESRHRFADRGTGSATAWLYGIAGFVYSRWVRQQVSEQRRATRLITERVAFDDERLAAVVELASDRGLMAALEHLPARQAQAIRAHVLDEQDYEDLAAADNTTEATIRKRVSRGLASLRRHAGEEDR